ncbi:MAG: hypothetical protein MMC23_009149 [Stictis urceolatum]|nr:hypothetical protein [Stictis urceolata]
MAAFVRKRLSEVFLRDSLHHGDGSPGRNVPEAPKIDSGHGSLQEADGLCEQGGADPNAMVFTRPKRSEVNAHNSLELLRSSTTVASPPRTQKATNKTSIRKFTASTLKRLSESIRSKRHMFYTDVGLLSDQDDDPKTEEEKPAGKENKHKNRMSLRSRLSFDVKQLPAAQEHQLSQSPIPPTVKNSNRGMVSSIRRRGGYSPRRLRTRDLINRRKSESDKLRQKPFGPSASSSRPLLDLDLPPVCLLSAHEKKMLAGISSRATSQPISIRETKVNDQDPFISAEANKITPPKELEVEGLTYSMAQKVDRVPSTSSATVLSPNSSSTLPVRSRGSESVFFRGQRGDSLASMGPSPLRKQMLRRSMSEVPRSISTDSGLEMCRIRKLTERVAEESHAEKEGPPRSPTPAKGFRDKWEQTRSDPFRRCATISSMGAETAEDSDTSPDLQTRRCRAHKIGEMAVADDIQDYTEPLQKGRFSKIHFYDQNLAEASSTQLSSSSVYSEECRLPDPKGLDCAIEAIDRINGQELMSHYFEPLTGDTLKEAMEAIDSEPVCTNLREVSSTSLSTQATGFPSPRSDFTNGSCAITTFNQPQSGGFPTKPKHHRIASLEALQSCKEPVPLSEELKTCRQAFPYRVPVGLPSDESIFSRSSSSLRTPSKATASSQTEDVRG